MIHLVIPCFDEEARLDEPELVRVGSLPGVRVHLVDDGSRDRTPDILDRVAAQARNVRVRKLPHNVGKAEAVRAGMVDALADGAEIVGYLDADLSTPVDAMLELVRVLDERSDVDVVLGSRVLMLGRRIEREPHRHYLGRIYATAASWALGMPVYDTQCGAKAFRRTPQLVRAVDRPFRTGWAFDVELLSRLLRGGGEVPGLDPARIVEIPLTAWRDVAGSKVTWRGGAKALADLWRIGRAHRRSG